MYNKNRVSGMESKDAKNQERGRSSQDTSMVERDVLTIKEAVKRAKLEGLPVSEYSLRKWVKSGEIPVRWIGTKALVYFPSLAAYLRFDSNIPKTPFDIPTEPEQFLKKTLIKIILSKCGVYKL